MQYGQRYRFQFGPTIYEGEYIQTKGDDDNYPTFVVEDGPRLGVHKDHVLGPVDDSCSPEGIERPTLDDSGFEAPNEAEEWGHIVDDHEDIPH